MGSTFCSVDVTPNSLAMLGTAMLGRAEPMVELMTSMDVRKRTKLFLDCEGVRRWGFGGEGG